MWPRFIFIAVEDDDPFAPAVYELDDNSLLKAASDIEPIRTELAPLYLNNVPHDKWPGYPAITNKISVPAWA